LDAERLELEGTLRSLERELASARHSDELTLFVGAPVTNNSPAADKVALFRQLFAGRTDVFPSVGKTRRRGDRVIHRPAPMNG
jgi:hypothetical protein